MLPKNEDPLPRKARRPPCKKWDRCRIETRGAELPPAFQRGQVGLALVPGLEALFSLFPGFSVAIEIPHIHGLVCRSGGGVSGQDLPGTGFHGCGLGFAFGFLQKQGVSWPGYEPDLGDSVPGFSP